MYGRYTSIYIYLYFRHCSYVARVKNTPFYEE